MRLPKQRSVVGAATVIAAIALLWPGPAARAAGLTRYETRYYTIYTDLDADGEREAAVRMTRMAEEYHDRTKTFAGVIRHKFPFYLFKSPQAYYAAGGLRGSAGVFMPTPDGGGKLMAIAGRRLTLNTWHTVQHEGFHQFAHAVIGGEIPTWLNEGLAEYFGEALFTGDSFVNGVVPPWRLQRLQGEIGAGTLLGVRQIMALSPGQWRDRLDVRNYDQAWSMVHFLVNGDGGKYLPAFAACIRELSAGKPFDQAWLGTVGPADGFEDRWRAYWTAQPKSPTAGLYARATVATLTSFLARATAERQAFPDLQAFVDAAEGDQLKLNADDWLPHDLLAGALRAGGLDTGTVAAVGITPPDGPPDAPRPRWELRSEATRQTLTLTLPDATRLTGRFVLNGNRVGQVNVDVDPLAKVVAEAAAVRDGGKRDRARDMVQAALRQNARSPAAADARAFLKTCR